MKVPPLLIHASVVAAIVLGTGGMGMVYDAVSTGNLRELTIGWPLLVIGLWWAGRYLAISMAVHRAQKAAGSPSGRSARAFQRSAVDPQLPASSQLTPTMNRGATTHNSELTRR